MGSETALRIPAIDFTMEDLKPGSGEWETVKSQVFKALEEFGCFEAFFNKVPADLKNGIIGSIEELFELPLESKLNMVSKKPFHGYVGQHPQLPLYESMGIDDAVLRQNVESVTSALWPQGNPTFSENVYSLTEKAAELNQIVRMMVVESLGLEKYMEEHLNGTKYILRVMKYEKPPSPEENVGLLTHTDKDFLTIVCQNQDGLEVKTKNGEWIECKPSPDSLVVFGGDSFNAWTNGRVYSPDHRVMLRGNRARYSAGLFSIPKPGYVVKAPGELVDEEHPLLFKPYDYMEFLAFLQTEAGQKSQTALRDYCGL